jgi:nickel superoxide dismutase
MLFCNKLELILNYQSINWFIGKKLLKIKLMKYKRLSLFIISSIFLIFNNSKSFAHCEIPCGIYGDSIRIQLLYEHIQTIEKSMKQIDELSSQEGIDHNQLVRWIMNKEEHASEIQYIVSQYFLHQRIKITDPSDSEAYKRYVNQLTLLHEMLVYAMKAKQTTDQVFIEKMRDTLHTFEHAYFE